MRQSPWRAYFGEIHKYSSSEKGPARHPVVVALTVVSLIGIGAAALYLRINRWYYGQLSMLSLCGDERYNWTRVRPIVPINESLAYSLSIAVPPVIVLFIEIIFLITSLDENEKNDGGDYKPRITKGSYLFLFRFLHFVAVHLLTLAFVSLLVDVTKIAFDWPRPYFLKRFPYNCNESFVHKNPHRAVSPEEMKARLGFPSHRVALLSSAVLLLTVHSIRTLQVMRSSGPLQVVITLTTAFAPLFAAASVLNSNQNRPEDVIVGFLIGVIGAACMASMLPTKLIFADLRSDTSIAKDTPTTVEELNFAVQMRPVVSYDSPRPPNGRSSNIVNQRFRVPSNHSARPGLTRIN